MLILFCILKIIYTAETFVVDTSNTKMLLEKHGDIIREKGILVISLSWVYIDPLK
jgi:ribosome biogenesis protein Tsr3